MKKYLLSLTLFFLSQTVIAQADVNISLSSQKITLGEPIKITIITSQPIKKYKIALNNKKFNLFLEKKNKQYKYSALIGINRFQKPGDYILKVDVLLKNKVRFYEHYKVSLNYKLNRKKGKVVLSKSKKKLSNRKKSYITEQKLISSNFKKVSNKKLYKSKFNYPAKGRMSSPFGRLRYYNNGNTSSHAGLDIANIRGTKIVAPERGVVIFSKKLDIHGKTIMIDHGHGVISIFCHLDKRNVSKRKIVKKGQKIGEMGNTGVASGVHLHWGMSVQNIRVDPLFFLKNKF